MRGEASSEIGFIIKVRLSANFEVTTGETRNTILPGDRCDRGNSQGDRQRGQLALCCRMARSTCRCASCRDWRSGAAPFGALEIQPKVAPLNIALQRFGSSRPDRGSIFKLEAVQINKAVVKTTATTEQFAPAQFFEMSDADKLSRPAFARYDSGLLIGADDAPQTDFRRGRELRYEVIYLPEHQPLRPFFKLAADVQCVRWATPPRNRHSLSIARPIGGGRRACERGPGNLCRS